MAIYDSQAEASQRIPQQWRAFRLAHPVLGSSAKLYGASPCTGDRRIHYLPGVAQEIPEQPLITLPRPPCAGTHQMPHFHWLGVR